MHLFCHRGRKSEIKVWAQWYPPKTPGKNPDSPVMVPSEPRLCLACASVTEVSASISTGIFASVSSLFSQGHQSLNLGSNVNWEWLHLEILMQLYLHRLSFQIRSQSEVQGGLEFWVGTIQLTTIHQATWSNFLIMFNSLQLVYVVLYVIKQKIFSSSVTPHLIPTLRSSDFCSNSRTVLNKSCSDKQL